MTTHEKQIATYLELDEIYTRNNPEKEEKRATELMQLSAELVRKRMQELAGDDGILLDYQSQIEKMDFEMSANDTIPSHIHRIAGLDHFSWAPTFIEKHNIQRAEVFLELANKAMKIKLIHYCEICESIELPSKIKVMIGNGILAYIRNIRDIGGQEFTPEIEKMIRVIQRRVNELEAGNKGEELYYWPLGNVSFEAVISGLRLEGFIADISSAKTIFEKFESVGLTLKWTGTKRQLMYFLMLLYKGRLHNSESITEIAFKLFDFKGKEKPGAKKSFTTDLTSFEKTGIDHLHIHRQTYKILHDILGNKNLN